jgi:hypothetical protein
MRAMLPCHAPGTKAAAWTARRLRHPRRHTVRYYGFYPNAVRGKRKEVYLGTTYIDGIKKTKREEKTKAAA